MSTKQKTTSHGINFLENRSKLLEINKTNKNDTIKILGSPLNKSLNKDNKWMYFETKKERGNIISLGKENCKK